MLWILDYVSVNHTRGRLEGDLADLWKKIKPLAVMAKYSDTCSGCYFYTKKILKLVKHLIPEQDPIEEQQQKTQTMQGNAKDVDAKTGQQPPKKDQKGNPGKAKGKGQPAQSGSDQGQGSPAQQASGQ